MAHPHLSPPKAGQQYRAVSKKTRGGYRYVRLERVYRPACAIWIATVREVSKSGRDLHPDHLGPTGDMIVTSFDIALYPDHSMPSSYELI